MKFIYSIIFLFLTFLSFSQEKNNSQIQTELMSKLPDDPTVPTDPLDPIEFDPVDPTTPTTLTPSLGSGEVGSTRGDLSVSKTGGAVYSIPIDLPPGVNNVAPSVSLNYSSHSGDGIAGWGWNIGGISKISRIASTIYHDGEVDEIDFDSLDRFALDGQRLILTSGIYGQVGSTYETENFSNNKITLLSGHGVSCFKIEYPDGNIAYYGIPGPDNYPSLDYVITKWENPQGLTINYEYDLSYLQGLTFRIKTIKYGSTSTDSVEFINKIEFLYSTKNKQETYYVGGYSFWNPKILSSIKITGNSVPYKNYYLTHDLTSTGFERLKSIQEKSGDNTKSLNPITFYYENNITNYNQMISYSHRGNDILPNQFLGDFTGNSEVEAFLGYKFRRLNSDYTITDIPFTRPTELTNSTFNIPIVFLNEDLELSNKNGYIGKKDVGDNDKFLIFGYNETNNAMELEYEKEITGQIYGSGNQSFYFGTEYNDDEVLGQKSSGCLISDFNGDKLSDFVTYKIEGGYLYIKYINLDRRITSNYVFDSPPINVGTTTYVPNYPNAPYHIGATRIMQGDYNGDGISDILLFRGAPYNKIEVYSLKNNQFAKLFEANYNLPQQIHDLATYPIILGDFNGDSKIDFLMAWESKILYSKGFTNFGFVTELLPNTFIIPDSTKRETYLTWDVNNDGKSDILRLESLYESQKIKKCDSCGEFWWIKSGIKMNFYEKKVNWERLDYEKITQDYINNSVPDYPSDDNTFRPIEPISVTQRTNQPNLAVLTIGGDNARFAGDNSYEVMSYFNFVIHPDDQTLLAEVNNGNGVRNLITYNNLKNGNGIYTTSNELTEYPYYNVLNNKNRKVISEIRELNSGSPTKKKQFKYYGAVFDTAGRGVSGFQATTSTNWFTQSSEIISTVNKYDFTKNGANIETFSMLGLIEPNYVLQSTDSYIARTINTYNHEDTGYVDPLLSNKVFKLFKTKTESFNGLTGTSSITYVNYNNYNNPINSTTTIKNGTTIEKMTNNIFNYDTVITSPYIVDRLNNKISTTTIQPSGDVYVSEEQYIYDVNLLKQIKKRTTNSGLTSDFITESNEYDVYGNLIQKKYSVPGIADRITGYEYDAQTHRFIIKKIDSELQETLYEYDQNTGLLLSETAPSNSGFPLKTTYTYDKWGKIVKITDYLGKISTITYTNIANNQGILKTISNSDNSSTKTIMDPLGRVLHEGYKTIEDKWSVKSTEYNIYDQPIKVTGNYFDGDIPEVWNEMQYDIYGRVSQSNHLKTSSSEGKITAYSYNGLTTVENDSLKNKTTIKNAIGQTVSLEDNPGEIITYEYFANGNLKKAITSGSTIEIQQDAFGRKKTLIDPSAGTRNYEYNKFGELTKEEIVDKGFTEFDLDANGKLLEKKITEAGTLKSKATYSYNGNKQLSNIAFNDYANNSAINYTYTYDDYKRLIFKEEIGNQFHFEQEITYDDFGRPEKQFYSANNLSDNKASNKWIKTEYKNGFSWKIYDKHPVFSIFTLLWETKEVNENGDILSAGLNNNALLLNKSYDMYGFPIQIKYSNELSDYMIQDTEFDPIYGNLKKRTSNLFGTNWVEDLSYDQLDRLTTWKDNEGIQNQSYNGNGTINHNKIGSYAYTISNKPFQVSTITPQFPSQVYNYYANREQNINYNINKKPVSITELNAENIDFEYNPMNSRSVMYYGNLEPNKTDRIYRKYYSADGSMEIKRNINTNKVEFITYVQGSPYNSSIVLKSDGTNQEYLYLLKDYQGTINGVVNAAGNIIEKRQFDVWGSLINFANASGITSVPTTANSLVLDRGYTSHEHLLGLNIINMNGRIYDYNLHKFLQPDNNIQDFYNTQNYNRYGYVMNNPTKYTDENGEFWQYIVGAVFNAYVAGYQSSGDFNPLHWNNNAWTNAGLGAASFGASIAATHYADNYISNYGNNNIEFVHDYENAQINPIESPWESWTQGFINEDKNEIFGIESQKDYGIDNGRAYAYYLKGNKSYSSRYFNGLYNYSFLEANASAYGDLDGFTLSADASYFKQGGELKAGLNGFNGHVGGNFEFLSTSTELSSYVHGGKQGVYGFESKAEAGAQVLKIEGNYGFTVFGAKFNFSSELTGLSAHIGHESAFYYDRRTGVLRVNDAAHLGWIIGGGGGIDVTIPVNNWGTAIQSLFKK